MCAFVDESDIQVSWRETRSGGREQETRSFKEMELFSFRKDRIFREWRRNFLGKKEGPGFTDISPHKRRRRRQGNNFFGLKWMRGGVRK